MNVRRIFKSTHSGKVSSRIAAPVTKERAYNRLPFSLALVSQLPEIGKSINAEDAACHVEAQRAKTEGNQIQGETVVTRGLLINPKRSTQRNFLILDVGSWIKFNRKRKGGPADRPLISKYCLDSGFQTLLILFSISYFPAFTNIPRSASVASSLMPNSASSLSNCSVVPLPPM